MNLNKQQSGAAGLFLIGLGLVWWLNLWWMILPGALAVGGFVAYQQRRRMGRTPEAVQVGLWGVGLALLFLLHFVWPGILFLAGASVLLRGREDRVDTYVQNAIAQAGRRSNRTARSVPTQQVPISTPQVTLPPPATTQPAEEERSVSTGETTRL
jgi:hypothetical protein